MWRRNREVRMGHRGLRAIVHVQPPLRRLWKFVCLWIVRPESSLSVHRVACPGIFSLRTSISCYFVCAPLVCQLVLVRTVVYFLRESVRPAMMFQDTQIKKVAERKKTFFGKQETFFDWLLFFLSFRFSPSRSFRALPMSCSRLWIVICVAFALLHDDSRKVIIF